MAFDRNAFSMLNTAAQQIQARIAAYQAAMKQNPAGAGMYQQAIAQEQQRLNSTNTALSQQQASVPVDNAGYAQQKSDIMQQTGAQVAANDYARSIAQQRHGRALGDFNVQAANQRNRFDSPFLQRGIFRSGIRQQGLQDMRAAQTSAYGNLVGQQTEELGNLANQRSQILAGRASQLSAVDRARQQAIAQYLQQNLG